MADLTLTPAQKQLQVDAATYASKYLAKAVNVHSRHLWPRHTHQRERFESTQSLYRTAVQYGLLKAQIPQELGGAQTSAVDAAVAFEEMYAADSSVTLTIAATGLGLLPLLLGGTPEQQKKFLQPFLVGKGEPLASLVHAEPGGTAGWLTDGSQGLQTTARKEGKNWIINGAKEGALNCAGWDRRGADFQCFVCRMVGLPYTDVSASLRESVVVLLVTRDLIAQQGREAYQVMSEPEMTAHPAVSGPYVRLRNFKVPDGIHVLAGPEKGASLIERCFCYHVALTGAFSISVMKSALEEAQRFTKWGSRGGNTPLSNYKGVAKAVRSLQARIDKCRSLTWSAVQSAEQDAGTTSASIDKSYSAMLAAQDGAVAAVTDAMRVIGPASYRSEQPFAQWLLTTAALPLIDIGVFTAAEGGHASRLDDQLARDASRLSL